MVCLGDYDQIPTWLDAQPGFNGDHSVWIHDYRASDDSVCWHDPLATAPRRVKWSVVVAYNQKPGSPVRGLAGFVRIVVALPPTDTEEPDMPGLDLRPLSGDIAAGRADVPKGTDVIYCTDKRRAKTTGTATNRIASGLWTPVEISSRPVGYEVELAEGMAWVRQGAVTFTPSGATSTTAFNAGVDAAVAAAKTARR
jgi:hypothetical protein